MLIGGRDTFCRVRKPRPGGRRTFIVLDDAAKDIAPLDWSLVRAYDLRVRALLLEALVRAPPLT